MSEAPEMPERIWAVHHETQGSVMIGEWGDTIRHIGGIEYIRADLVEAAVKRAIEACAEIAEETTEDKLRGHDLGQCASTDIRTIASDPEAIAKIVRGE